MSSHRLLFSAVLAALLAAGSARAETWTLERAVATALEQSPDARIARARVDGAQALVEQARSAWLPQLTVSGRYTETNSPMMAFGSILNQRAFNNTIDFNHPGQIDNLNATGTIGYNLYSGGRATAGRTAARAGAEAADLDLQAARQQLAAEVVKAALNLRKAREAVGAVEAGVKAYDAAVAVARARFEAGQMLKSDLLSLEVQLAQTRESLSAARHSAALAARAFRFVLGLDASEEPVELAEDDPTLARLTAPDSRDVSHRPELLGLQARLRAAEAMVDSARGARRPTVNAFASYQYDKGWEMNRDGKSWLAGVSVDVNVFDGGQTSGKIRQSRAEVTQVKEMLRKATLGMELEAEQARLAHADARERLNVTTAAVAQAEESAALTRARFEKQAVLTADVIGAESRLIEARLRHTFAAVDERLALVGLRRALGLDPLPTTAADSQL
ncbi:TolC family protein [Opitutus terrae]|uniref:Outer membrane efflux protein n=1 Tax=Opitutus terrae (strain DSM 11246 / JCM 15787 / PB90-1) TaxID=452637 RepID=B1ZSP1_OPITP|nr:TolC family protein [Opitutus terrae]ACB74740.1 outer membrane efflux protein [Opitutus terrae PB90-1]